MEIKKRKAEIKNSLEEIRKEAIHLIANIDISLFCLHDVNSQEDLKEFIEKNNLEYGLKQIRVKRSK